MKLHHQCNIYAILYRIIIFIKDKFYKINSQIKSLYYYLYKKIKN
jgi:hypothetical protein